MIVCVVGGATVWQQVCPNTVDRMLGEPAEESRGLSKFGWFSALNISARSAELQVQPFTEIEPFPNP